MDGAGLETVIRELVEDQMSAMGNVIEFEFENVPLICIYDEAHNRMRIISPIKAYSEVTDAEKDQMMESNFHSALDARYCVSNDVLYAAYIHPLSPLKNDDVLSGIYQVASLHLSYGKEYSSGLLSFGKPDEGEPDPA